MYQLLFEALITESADISCCGYRGITEKEEFVSDATERIDSFNRHQFLSNYYTRQIPFDTTFLWNKLFKRELFQSVRLNPKIHIQEDTEVLLKLITKSHRVVYIGYSLYNYIIRNNTLSTNKDLEYYKSLNYSLKEIYIYTMKNIKYYEDFALQNYIEQIFNNIVAIVKENYPKSEYRNLRREIICLFPNIIRNNKLALKYKIHAIFITVCPLLYVRYIRVRIMKFG